MWFIDESDVRADPADPKCFTEGVFFSEMLPARAPSGMRASRFTYEPGARSHWHTHSGEQSLYVVAGRGLVQLAGEDTARVVLPGSWVHVKPGERHWHGAALDDVFVHLAITASGGTTWHEPVD